MSSPDSAFCHHHSVTPAQKTITLSSQEAPICSAQQDMSRGFVFLFRKKPNQIKTLRQIKRPRKKSQQQQRMCSWLLLFPSFSFQETCFSSIFFTVQFQQLEALPKPPEAAPASPAARLSWGSWCTVLQVQFLTWEAEDPSEGEQEIYSRVTTLSATI